MKKTRKKEKPLWQRVRECHTHGKVGARLQMNKKKEGKKVRKSSAILAFF